MLRWLQDRARTQRIGRTLYDSIVAQSRSEAFYRALCVPDTIEGRFELIVLHMYLVLERLRNGGKAGDALSRALIEAFVADMDGSMREMGISDLGVPRRVKRAAAALFERSGTYAAAVKGEADTLPAALAEHILDQSSAAPERAQRLAAYTREAAASLRGQASSAVLAGRVEFPPIEATAS